jgi:hypothetical protein
MITFGEIKMLTHPTKTGRQLVAVDIFYNNETYHWLVYAPSLMNGESLMAYLNANATKYENNISKKEALWAVSPHTREIKDMNGNAVIVDIPKGEVVCANLNDYQEMAAEPSMILEQISALEDEDKNSAIRIRLLKLQYADNNDNTTLAKAKTNKQKLIKTIGSELLWAYFSKALKDVSLSSASILTARDTRRNELKTQAQTMYAEINLLTTIDEVVNYQINFV